MSEVENTAGAGETPAGVTETPVAASESKPSAPRGGRIALGAALVIALAAGGVAVWRNREAPPAAAPAATAQQPSVDEVITKLEARLMLIRRMPRVGGCSAGRITRPNAMPKPPPR